MPATPVIRTADATLFAALLAAAREQGMAKPILEDAERKPLTYRSLILGSLVLGAKLTRGTRRGETIGVLLPNVNAMAVTIFGLNCFGRVSALLNFTAGERNLASAVRTALIGRIVTSRRFVDQARLGDAVRALETMEAVPGRKVEIVYLEDVRKAIGVVDKGVGALASLLPAAVHRHFAARPEQPAVILFTSGTEGAPKGVVLSSSNLVANAYQCYQHAGGQLGPTDIVFNPLPMFHSYGLTAGTLLPLLNGMKAVLYPSPLHYRQIPKLIGETRATMLVATDTFLQGYGRAAEPEDLRSVRFVVAGAERVKEVTRELWSRSGTVLLEGYGATECGPVVAFNLPETNRPGTVGALLPGVEARLEPVEGVADGGRLFIKGPNVMLGYMTADMPGVIVPPPDGWHDTGDIVTIAKDRFMTIRGRAKRFAKIGGEMVSLAAVENAASSLWPDSNHAVVSVPDARKGEQLVLVTDKADADKSVLMKHAQAAGLPEMWVPRSIIIVPAVPVLGTGKVDYAATLDLVRRAKDAD